MPYSAYGITLVDNTLLRSNANNQSLIQGMLASGTVVFIQTQAYDDSGMQWHLVQAGDKIGYIRADFVRTLTAEEIQAYLNSLVTPTPAVSATPAPSNLSSWAILIRDQVNLRKTPSSQGTSLGRLAKDRLVLVLGSETTDYTWYRVDYRGTTGYIRSDMVAILTYDEAISALQTQGSSGSSSSLPDQQPVSPDWGPDTTSTIPD